jgi:hypothetical protein
VIQINVAYVGTIGTYKTYGNVGQVHLSEPIKRLVTVIQVYDRNL